VTLLSLDDGGCPGRSEDSERDALGTITRDTGQLGLPVTLLSAGTRDRGGTGAGLALAGGQRTSGPRRVERSAFFCWIEAILRLLCVASSCPIPHARWQEAPWSLATRVDVPKSCYLHKCYPRSASNPVFDVRRKPTYLYLLLLLPLANMIDANRKPR
jgi:hypothetical protein